MKAIVVTAFGGPEHMMWEDVSTPVIKENEVLIKVVKTSVNFADIKARYRVGKGELSPLFQVLMLLDMLKK